MIRLRPSHISCIACLPTAPQRLLLPLPVQHRLPSLIISTTALSHGFTLIPRRAFSSKKTSSPVKDAVQRKAAAAKAAKEAEDSKKPPERLLIYHAGTGRITFLAMLRLTSLFIGAWFLFIVVPSYVKEERSALETAGVALSGLIPILFISTTTAPFVTHIHIHLPASHLLKSSHSVRRSLPPSTPLTLTTMSLIGKPRYSSVPAGDLLPCRKRLGLVNYTRDASAENVGRRWWEFRAVSKFYVQDAVVKKGGGGGKGAERYKEKRGRVEGWVWDEIKELVEKRARSKAEGQ